MLLICPSTLFSALQRQPIVGLTAAIALFGQERVNPRIKDQPKGIASATHLSGMVIDPIFAGTPGLQNRDQFNLPTLSGQFRHPPELT